MIIKILLTLVFLQTLILADVANLNKTTSENSSLDQNENFLSESGMKIQQKKRKNSDNLENNITSKKNFYLNLNSSSSTIPKNFTFRNIQEVTYDLSSYFINNTMNVLSISPFEIFYVSFNFTKVPSDYIFRRNFSLSIATIVDNIQVIQDMPAILDNDNIFLDTSNNFINIRIFNFNQISQDLTIILSTDHHTSDNFVNEYFYNTTNTTQLFSFILLSSTFTPLNLPYNIYSDSDQTTNLNLLIDFNSQNSSFTYERDIITGPFQQLYWDNQNLNALAVPWIPFFSNCANYDQRMILFDLLENNENCLFPKDLAYVRPFPITGLSPISDVCNINLECSYDEVINSDYPIDTRWFGISESQTLMYVTSLPIFIANVTNSLSSIYLQEIQENSKSFIPVNFVPVNYIANCLPTKIVMDIKYHQVDENVKTLSMFIIHLQDYTYCLSSNLDNTNMNGGNIFYALEINYQAMEYFTLIKYFQFNSGIYFFIIFLIDFIILMIILLFLYLFAFFSVSSKDDSFHIANAFKIYLNPLLKGLFLCIVIIIMTNIFIMILQNSHTISSIIANWNNVGDIPSNDEVTQNSSFRAPGYFLIIGFLLNTITLNLFIPKPCAQELNQIDKDHNKNVRAKTSEFSNLFIDYNRIMPPIDWKRNTTMIKNFALICYFMIKLQFSFSAFFVNNQITFVVVNCIMDLLCEEFSLWFIYEEALLVCPILCVNKILTFLVILKANETFLLFLTCHLISLFINLAYKILLIPKIDYFIFSLKKKLKKISQNYPVIEKLLGYVFNLNVNNISQNNENEFITSTTDTILRTLSSFSVNSLVIFTSPLLIVFFFRFFDEFQISQFFSIPKDTMFFYMAYVFGIILPDFLLEVFTLELLETLYGLQIKTYIKYACFRYSIRSTAWIKSSITMDPSISLIWRSLDAMLFSVQYYLVLCLSSVSLFLITLSLSIMVISNYNPFNDPLFFVLFMILVCFFLASYIILKLASRYVNLWNKKFVKFNDAEAKILDFVQLEPTTKYNRNILITDVFRYKFISVNKDWIIKNLDYILHEAKSESKDKEKEISAIYKQALTYQTIDRQIQSKKEEIIKSLQLLPYNLDYIGQIESKYGTRLDISIDSDNDLPNSYFKVNARIHNEKNSNLALLWLSRAKENIKFKRWSVSLLMQKRKEKCEKCNSNFNLHLIQEVSFDLLIKDYKNENMGKVYSELSWKKFYLTNQKFLTLCMECAYFRNTEAMYNNDRSLNKKVQNENNRDKKINRIRQNHKNKELLLHWLMNTRSKILIEKNK